MSVYRHILHMGYEAHKKQDPVKFMADKTDILLRPVIGLMPFEEIKKKVSEGLQLGVEG